MTGDRGATKLPGVFCDTMFYINSAYFNGSSLINDTFNIRLPNATETQIDALLIIPGRISRPSYRSVPTEESTSKKHGCVKS